MLYYYFIVNAFRVQEEPMLIYRTTVQANATLKRIWSRLFINKTCSHSDTGPNVHEILKSPLLICKLVYSMPHSPEKNSRLVKSDRFGVTDPDGVPPNRWLRRGGGPYHRCLSLFPPPTTKHPTQTKPVFLALTVGGPWPRPD